MNEAHHITCLASTPGTIRGGNDIMPQYQTPNGIITYAYDPRFINMLLNGENRVEKSYGVYSPGGSPRYHYGIDVDTTGSDWRVFSTVSGKVVMSTIVTNKSDKTWEWGHFVCILDGNGYRHYFCHLASRSVSVGQVVKAGDMIGVMGKTGNAAGDTQAEHVHYEVRKSPYSSGAACSLDPTPWCGIPNKQGQTITETSKGVQTMKVVDVYAQATSEQTGTKFNVQTFNTASVTDIAGNNLPDGRYWCNETGVSLGSGFTGAQIMVDGKAVYVAILSGATEYTDMSMADAYARFIKTANGSGYTDAEVKALQAQLAAVAADKDAIAAALTTAQGKITAAQNALK